MLGARFTGEIFVDSKRWDDPDGWLTGVTDNNKRSVIRSLDLYVRTKLLPRWMAEHRLEFHITDRDNGETIII